MGLLVWALGAIGYLRNDQSSVVLPSIAHETAEQVPVLLSNRGSNLLQIQALNEACFSDFKNEDEDQLELESIGHSFILNDGTNDKKHERVVLFQNISLTVGPGDMYLVIGPSGVGKSSLLKIVAGLMPFKEGRLLFTKHRRHEVGSTEWRRQVRYVTHHKVTIPGTPIDFINRIASFQSWTKQQQPFNAEQLQVDAGKLLRDWGLSVPSILEKDWSVLSGGEAQRVIAALAMVS